MLNNNFYDYKRRLNHHRLIWLFWEIIYGSNWLLDKRYKDYDFKTKLIEDNKDNLILDNSISYIYNNSWGIRYNNIKKKKSYKYLIDRYAYTPNAKTYWENYVYNNNNIFNKDKYLVALNILTKNSMFFNNKDKKYIRLPDYGLLWLFVEIIYTKKWFWAWKSINYDYQFKNRNNKYFNNRYFNNNIRVSIPLERDPFINIDEYEKLYIKGEKKNILAINSKKDSKNILYNLYDDQYEQKSFTFQNFITFLFFNITITYIFNLVYIFILYNYLDLTILVPCLIR